MVERTTDFGKRLYTLRKREGLTQLELAKKVGLAKPTITRYETGTITNIPLATVAKLAEVLNCAPGELLGWDDKDNTDLADMTNADIDLYLIGQATNKLTTEQKESLVKMVRYMYPEIFEENDNSKVVRTR